MAFRKEVFDKYGTFRTDLGRAGTSMISNEDTEFGRRLFAAGEPLRYERSAITFHPVEEARLRQGYFLEWWFNKGRSDIRETMGKHSGKRLFGVPLRLVGTAASQLVRWMVSTEASQRFNHKADLWNCTGQVLEFSLLWRAAKNGKGLKGHSNFRRTEKGDR